MVREFFSFAGLEWHGLFGGGFMLMEKPDEDIWDKGYRMLGDSGAYVTFEGGVRLKKNGNTICDIYLQHIDDITPHDRGINFFMLRFPF